MGSAEVTVPITLLLVKELTVLGSFRYGVSSCCVNSMKENIENEFMIDDSLETTSFRLTWLHRGR